MMTDDTFDFGILLQPLMDNNGCGSDLQYDAAYNSIRLGRQAEQNTLPSGVWERQAKKIDWDNLYQQCFDILALRSKDMQVTAWLVETLVYRDRLPGLAHGMRLFVEMAITFWEYAYPQIEQGDPEVRLRPVEWLLRECGKWVATGSLAPANDTETGSDSAARHPYWQTVDTELIRLESFLNERVADFMPSFREVRACIRGELAACAAPYAGPVARNAQSAVASFPGQQQVHSRDSAYDQLREIAAFLARIEPHSPVPIVLQGLVAWRNAHFEDLLERLPQNGPSVYELVKLFKSAPDK